VRWTTPSRRQEFSTFLMYLYCPLQDGEAAAAMSWSENKVLSYPRSGGAPSAHGWRVELSFRQISCEP
jgi:hypothetical protein